MKHTMKVTIILLAMFFVTQMIGLAVISAYMPKVVQVTKETAQGIIIVNETIKQDIPYGMEPPPEMKPEVSATSIAISIAIATLLFLLLRRIKANFIIKIWFFSVIFITTSVALNALLSYLPFNFRFEIIALIIALPLAFYKVVKRNIIIHNLTELLVYPGLAAVFVPILNVFWAIALLVLIALWDIYAVWHSKIMVSMAKYQMQHLKIFAGFFLPYASKKTLQEIKKLRKLKKIGIEMPKSQKMKKMLKERMKKIKISLAILGGGDVAFPIIFSGVVMKTSSFADAFIVAIAATISLFLLFVVAKKEKFYPAMPFLSAGCIIGYIISLLI